ncbi:hypothetical protein [Coxiella burnetii]|uniref:hypothetical protein n=1 Tax=Coxiella burnetii TaxID=777 RepID=UPI00057C5B2D|nr:hypothetical protein [Coxiella burnetii]
MVFGSATLGASIGAIAGVIVIGVISSVALSTPVPVSTMAKINLDGSAITGTPDTLFGDATVLFTTDK